MAHRRRNGSPWGGALVLLVATLMWATPPPVVAAPAPMKGDQTSQRLGPGQVAIYLVSNVRKGSTPYHYDLRFTDSPPGDATELPPDNPKSGCGCQTGDPSSRSGPCCCSPPSHWPGAGGPHETIESRDPLRANGRAPIVHLWR